MEMSESKIPRMATLIMFSLIVLPFAQALPNQTEVENAALRYVLTSNNYVDNGGFGERVLNISLNEDVSMVVVSYQTRSVGMLQMIGSFISYIKIDSSTLEILGSETSATIQIEQEEPASSGSTGSSDNSTGSGSVDPDPVAPDPTYPDPDEPAYTNVTDPYEPLRERATYNINKTLKMIWTTSVKANFSEALDLIDWAWESMDAGDYKTALDIASKAYELVYSLIYGDPTPLPDDPLITPAPELWGFIVIFDHEPTPEDWDRLEKEFGARYGGDAQDYLGEKNAYFVETNTTTPEELRQAEGIKDAQEVLFFNTQTDPTPTGSEDSHPDTDGSSEPPSPQGEIPETILLISTIIPVSWAYRKQRN